MLIVLNNVTEHYQKTERCFDNLRQKLTPINDLSLICRAHQLVMEGFKFHFEHKNLVTVWSAPNYCYRCGNVAAVLSVNEDLKKEFKLFHEVNENENEEEANRRNLVPYFL